MERYHLGKRIHRHRRRTALVAVSLIVLGGITTAIILAPHLFKPDTVIKESPASVTALKDNEVAAQHFSESVFSLSLPGDWKFVGHKSGQYNIYSWHNTAENPGARMLDVYVDTIPTSLGVNRVMPVQAAGDRVVPTTVSDNCSDFTDQKVPGPPAAPAKWQGISFLCDLANYVRNVTGTSSAKSINAVTLTGKKTGQHKFFFTYTDNTASPDFNIFSNALQSFRVK